MWEALQNTPLTLWIDSSRWAYTLILACHGLGMALVVGLTVVISMRVLGFPAEGPLSAYRELWPILIWAFAVNAVSGVLLFVHDAVALSSNPSFIVKMAAIVVGGVLLWRLDREVLVPAAGAGGLREVRVAGSATAAAAPASARLLAAGCIAVWLVAVTVSGRLIAYISAYLGQ